MSAVTYDVIKFCVKVHEWPAQRGVREHALSPGIRNQLELKLVSWLCEMLPPEVVVAEGQIEIRLSVLLPPDKEPE